MFITNVNGHDVSLEEVTKEDLFAELKRALESATFKPGRMLRIKHDHYLLTTHDNICELERKARNYLIHLNIEDYVITHSLITGELLIERVLRTKGLPNGILNVGKRLAEGSFEGVGPKK